MATINNKINPQVTQYIKPIVDEMSAILIAQRSNPMIGINNEPPVIKEKKKECVHLIVENGEYQLATRKTSDGKLVCSVCGRVINTTFDEAAIHKITDSIEVVNQLLLFGMINGLNVGPIQNLISLKKSLPAAAQLMRELNDFVARDTAATNDEKNIGIEYGNPSSLRNITGY